MRRFYLALALICSVCLVGKTSSTHAQTAVRVCVGMIGPGGQLNCIDGWLPKLLNGLTTTVTAVKTSQQALLGTVYCYNPNSSVAYIQLFDVATAAGVTLATTVPKLSLGIPATTASGTGPTAVGITFYNGLQAAVTTTATGNTAPSIAMDCDVTYD